MNGQRGKMTFMSLIAMIILVAGGFMAFKYIGTEMGKKQIKKEVFDTLGTYRGGQMTDVRATEIIEEILTKKQVEILDVAAGINSSNYIDYSFSYRLQTDYLLFKRSEIIEVAGEIANYN